MSITPEQRRAEVANALDAAENQLEEMSMTAMVREQELDEYVFGALAEIARSMRSILYAVAKDDDNE